jgi:hypothetical protein
VVWVGETDLELPVTVPMFWLIDKELAPKTDQAKVLDPPLVMDGGVAVKEEITGAGTVGRTEAGKVVKVKSAVVTSKLLTSLLLAWK